MRRLFFVALSGFLVSLAGCWTDPEPGPNLAPRVNGFIVNGERRDSVLLREGESITVTVVAWDPNGDTLDSGSISWETTGGTVEGQGSSVRILAPSDIVWETPPQEVLMTVTATVSDGVNDPVSGDLTVEVLPPCQASNLPPVIHGVYSDPEGIALGESARVWVVAEDPEGLELTYTWTPPFGAIVGSGDDVLWVTDQVCCTTWYDIEVVVSDGCKSSWSFVSVHVDV
ncbi:MAG: hypothetical protein RBU30_05615 [Polyangia bacterium]|jgi:hypothetical protein|nr:hypothetical protein [Polyangia bacterium]